MLYKESPCKGCTRVLNPDGCENKYCKEWKAWFLCRWAQIYGYGQRHGCAGKGANHELEK